MTQRATGALFVLAATACSPDAPPDQGYTRAVLTRDAKNPMALAVTPGSDVYFIERTGEVRLFRRSTGLVEDALFLEVDPTNESGLLGLALDPSFSSNGYVYLYYSAPLAEPLPENAPPGENVLARFTAREDGTIDPESRTVLLTVPSERLCCHEGGALAFAPDGTLYLSTGDNTNPFAAGGHAPIDGRPGRENFDARRTASNPFDLRGKILRLNSDGSIPDGNLFPASGEQGRPEIYAMGVRNPFRLAVDERTGHLYFGDIGPDAVEASEAGPRGMDEINLVEAPGDFGWPRCLGDNLPYSAVDFATGQIGEPFDCAGLVPALFAYDYFTPTLEALGTGVAPSGAFLGTAAMVGTVYRTSEMAPFRFRAESQGAVIMMDWARDVIAAVSVRDGAAESVERLFAKERFHRPIDIETGPDGALYVLEYGSGFWGDNADAGISRIEGGTRRSPIAVNTPSVTHGSAPLTVSFRADGSRPAMRGETIVGWGWDFDGDGAPDSRADVAERRFDEPGKYGVSLVVTSSSGARSLPVAATITVGNAPPSVRILAPDRGAILTPGVPVTLFGEATDPEDGAAACEELVWNVSIGHNSHGHPARTLSGCEQSFTPDLADHASTSAGERLFYAIELSYTDHGGANGEAALTGRQGITVAVAR